MILRYVAEASVIEQNYFNLLFVLLPAWTLKANVDHT